MIFFLLEFRKKKKTKVDERDFPVFLVWWCGIHLNPLEGALPIVLSDVFSQFYDVPRMQNLQSSPRVSVRLATHTCHPWYTHGDGGCLTRTT